MMKGFIITVLLLLAAVAGTSQMDNRNTLTVQQVNQLVKLLPKKMNDAGRFQVRIRLAKYMFEKGLNGKLDIDSAASLIRQAKEINAGRFEGREHGLILLYEAMLARRSGRSDSARPLMRQAINELRSSNNHFALAEAYLELSRMYDTHDPKGEAIVRSQIDTLFRIVPKLIPSSQLDSCMATLRNFYILSMYFDNMVVQKHYLDQYARVCRSLHKTYHEFWARREGAYAVYKQGQLNEAIHELLKLIKEQKESDNTQICYTYDRLSFYYFIATDYEKSMYYSLEATKHVRDATDSAYLPQLCETVSINYRQRGNASEAVTWTLKGIDYMNVSQKYDDLHYTLSYLTRDMVSLGRANEVLKILQENSRKSPPQSNADKMLNLMNLGQVYLALQNYAAAEKYSEALVEMVDALIKRNELLGDDDVRAYQYLATHYLTTGNYQKSEHYFKKTVANWPKSAHTQGREYEHRFRYRLDSARGDYRSAFQHFKVWHHILDSTLSVTKAKQFDEIQTAYKTEQKDSLINLKEQNIQLLTKQDQLQKSQLEQGSIIRNISLAAAGLSIMILALLFNRYRLKKRTNKKLEIKQAEIEQQNGTLRRVVTEKEWLLKEIHHRVKNNLQIVMSLLNSQSAYIDNPYALTAIHDSQHRVHAMSLIHQKLYGSEGVSSIDMSVYIREMVAYLTDSFDISGRIRFDLSVDTIKMDVSQAVPLGLILNEAMTNAIKYAFPDGRSGRIFVSLTPTTSGQYLLRIADDGIGMPLQMPRSRPDSLGMSLMKGLSEDIEGEFSIESREGTTINVAFARAAAIRKSEMASAPLTLNN